MGHPLHIRACKIVQFQVIIIHLLILQVIIIHQLIVLHTLIVHLIRLVIDHLHRIVLLIVHLILLATTVDRQLHMVQEVIYLDKMFTVLIHPTLDIQHILIKIMEMLSEVMGSQETLTSQTIIMVTNVQVDQDF